MMVCRYDDSRLLLVLQVDHSRIAGLFAAHWGNAEFAEPRPYAAMAWPPRSTTAAGGSGRPGRP